jgi:hypothetical protein
MPTQYAMKSRMHGVSWHFFCGGHGEGQPHVPGHQPPARRGGRGSGKAGHACVDPTRRAPPIQLWDVGRAALRYLAAVILGRCAQNTPAPRRALSLERARHLRLSSSCSSWNHARVRARVLQVAPAKVAGAGMPTSTRHPFSSCRPLPRRPAETGVTDVRIDDLRHVTVQLSSAPAAPGAGPKRNAQRTSGAASTFGGIALTRLLPMPVHGDQRAAN